MPASLAVQEIGRPCAAESVAPERHRHADGHARFEIYRAERVSLTSILFSGGDWRWRFRSAAGTILVNSEGYSSERACRAAVTALQNNAGSAKVAEQARC